MSLLKQLLEMAEKKDYEFYTTGDSSQIDDDTWQCAVYFASRKDLRNDDLGGHNDENVFAVRYNRDGVVSVEAHNKEGEELLKNLRTRKKIIDTAHREFDKTIKDFIAGKDVKDTTSLPHKK